MHTKEVSHAQRKHMAQAKIMMQIVKGARNGLASDGPSGR